MSSDIVWRFQDEKGRELVRVCIHDWKMSFAAIEGGNIATSYRFATNWALIANLRMDRYKRAQQEGANLRSFLLSKCGCLFPCKPRLKDWRP
jgi:hypothetical protein